MKKGSLAEMERISSGMLCLSPSHHPWGWDNWIWDKFGFAFAREWAGGAAAPAPKAEGEPGAAAHPHTPLRFGAFNWALDGSLAPFVLPCACSSQSHPPQTRARCPHIQLPPAGSAGGKGPQQRKCPEKLLWTTFVITTARSDLAIKWGPR